MLELFQWDEATFLSKTEGTPMRRAGHERWIRNIAVALGNAPFDMSIITALIEKLNTPSALINEHTKWALAQQYLKQAITLEHL